MVSRDDLMTKEEWLSSAGGNEAKDVRKGNSYDG